MEPAVPALRILRPKNGKDGLFDYAIGANDSRWDTFVFASLALSAVTALVIALEALIGG